MIIKTIELEKKKHKSVSLYLIIEIRKNRQILRSSSYLPFFLRFQTSDPFQYNNKIVMMLIKRIVLV